MRFWSFSIRNVRLPAQGFVLLAFCLVYQSLNLLGQLKQIFGHLDVVLNSLRSDDPVMSHDLGLCLMRKQDAIDLFIVAYKKLNRDGTHLVL